MALVILTSSFVFVISSVSGMQETCTKAGFQYQAGSAFHSVKPDGSQYSCLCTGFNCRQISCRQISGPTGAPLIPTAAESTLIDEIEGPVPTYIPTEAAPTQSARPRPRPRPSRPVYQPAVFVPASPSGNENTIQVIGSGTCNDEESRKVVQRGSSFIRLSKDRIRRICTCPFSGPPVISCRVERCTMPKAPRVDFAVYASLTSIRNCYDPWLDQEIENGRVYNRTRYMDVHNSQSGTYECTCTNSTIRCTALDIPCCNLESNEFVGLNQRFVTMLGGSVMECTCNREYGRFSDCTLLKSAGRTPIYGNNPIPITAGRRLTCRDRITQISYPINSEWNRIRSGIVYRCRCRLLGLRRVQTTCFYPSN